MNYGHPQLRERLAAEYVLGTLHGGARRRFQRLLRADPQLRAAVERWEQRLVPMAASLEAAAPRAALWRAIEQRIAPATRQTRGAAASAGRSRWLRWSGFGALAAGVALGAALVFLTPLVRDQLRDPATFAQLPQSYVGFLQDERGQLTALISSLRHGRIVDVKVLRPIEAAPGDAGGVLQLWALFKDAPPLRVGTIAPKGTSRLTLPDTSEKLLSKATAFALSREAAEGAVTPTEPFLLRGPCGKLW